MTVELIVNKITVERTDNVFDVEISPVQQTVEMHRGTLNLTYDGTQTTVVAATALGGHRVVTLEGNYASKDTATDKFKVLGLTNGAVSSGHTATVTTYGLITEGGWSWTVGNPVFLSTNGHLTQTPPASGFRMIVGRPMTATTLFIDISEPINLG